MRKKLRSTTKNYITNSKRRTETCVRETLNTRASFVAPQNRTEKKQLYTLSWRGPAR
jgi:hypothetical protein